MNEYLKQYIELQKQFRETEGNPDSVRALYTFKEELEQSEDQQAKEVLVDVYDLLDFKKDAYGQPIRIQWLAYEKSVRDLGKETMDTITEIILDTDHSGHDCTLERL